MTAAPLLLLPYCLRYFFSRQLSNQGRTTSQISVVRPPTPCMICMKNMVEFLASPTANPVFYSSKRACPPSDKCEREGGNNYPAHSHSPTLPTVPPHRDVVIHPPSYCMHARSGLIKSDSLTFDASLDATDPPSHRRQVGTPHAICPGRTSTTSVRIRALLNASLALRGPWVFTTVQCSLLTDTLCTAACSGTSGHQET